MKDEQLEKILAEYAKDLKYTPAPREIKDRLADRVLERINTPAPLHRQPWALGMLAVSVTIILALLFSNKTQKQITAPNLPAPLKEEHAQSFINSLSDEEFVVLLMDLHKEDLLTDYESQLLGLDLEVVEFVDMAG